MAVLFYHADFVWARGGFLGVEVFFVISGYLITSLLLLEWLRTGTIGLKRFWLRRARRLLPALFTLLIVVSSTALLVYRDTLGRMLGDVIASLGYVTNWYLIVKQVSYFESFGRPPLLQHLWSLSVEEQFYVLWPLIFSFGMALLRARTRKPTVRAFLGFIVAGVLASTALMAILFTPYADPSRVYYGTDTRASGILVGAALALVWIPWRLPRSVPLAARRVLGIIGVSSIAMLFIILSRMDEFAPFLYRGGFLLTSVVTAVVIAMTVHPASSIAAVLEWAPLKWIGTRSYGIYLWHWPIFMVTRPGFELGWNPYATLALRLAVTFGIAEVSYRFIESPIRHRGFRAWVSGIRHAVGIETVRGGSAVLVGAVTIVALLFAGLTAGMLGHDEGGVIAASGSASLASAASLDSVGTAVVESGSEAIGEMPDSPAVDGVSRPVGSSELSNQDVAAGAAELDVAAGVSELGTGAASQAPRADAGASSSTPVDPASELPTVSIIGDSVVAGAQAVIKARLPNPVVIDAVVNRQFKHATRVIRRLRASGELGEVVVIHLGTNGAFSGATFDEVIGALPASERVIVLTAKVPRRWERSVNDTIRAGAKRWPNVEVVDWHSIGGSHPEWFNPDRVHLNRRGMEAYAKLLDSAING